MDYDATISAGNVTLGFKKAEGGRYDAFWQEGTAEADPFGRFPVEDFVEPTSPAIILPNGERTPEGGKAWIHGDRVAVIGKEDWATVLGRLGLAPA